MSIKVNVYNKEAKKVSDMELSAKVFGVESNDALIHQAMVAQLGNERQVLAHTKTKGEVSGGGKKPWRQKGTGRARAGSSRSPIWIGGGVTFGPRSTRNFKKNINKKMRQKAMFMVLSDRLENNNLAVLDDLKLEEFKTKTMDKIVSGFEKSVFAAAKTSEKASEEKKSESKKRSVLVVTGTAEEKSKYSTRNLVGVKIINLGNINILDLLKYRNLILAKDALAKIDEIYVSGVKKEKEEIKEDK